MSLMSEVATTVKTESVTRNTGLLHRLRAFYQRSEGFQGYTLLSPTLLVMLFSMCVPFAMMVVLSFWTQDGYDFDTTMSMKNYAEVIDGPRSVVFQQGHNRLHAARAVIAFLTGVR